MGTDIITDCRLKLSDRTKGSSPDAPARDLCKPALHLVQPGRAGRREVDLISCVIRKPLLYVRVFVGSIVVENEVNTQARRRSRFDLIEEAQEFLVAVPWLALADDLTRGNVQSCE